MSVWKNIIWAGVLILLFSVGLSAQGVTVDSSGNLNVAGTDAKVQENGAPLVPKGIITMWYGAINQIPDGWVICDGQNGTPDLRGRFVVGFNSTVTSFDQIKEIGGSSSVTLIKANIPTHDHNVTVQGNYTPSGSVSVSGAGPGYHPDRHNGQGWGNTIDTHAGNDQPYQDHSHGATFTGHAATITSSGTTNAGNGLSATPTAVVTLPPYMVLAYIMKL